MNITELENYYNTYKPLKVDFIIFQLHILTMIELKNFTNLFV